MTIGKKIQTYQQVLSRPHHRYRSWEHCYRYFHHAPPEVLATDRDQAALQLGFYLASWGMYRGSGFLLQHAYTIHLDVIDCILARKFSTLWETEIGQADSDVKLIPLIFEAIDAIRQAYKPFAPQSQASDTLVSKILLGTLVCVPACDRLFISGFKSAGFKYSHLSEAYLRRVLGFCRDHRSELRAEQENIERLRGIRYPVMKLVDTYFWQIGFDRADPASRDDSI